MTHQYISLCHTNYSLNVTKEIKQIYLHTHTIKGKKKLRVFIKTGSKQAGMQAMSNAQSSWLRQALVVEGQLCYQGLLCV